MVRGRTGWPRHANGRTRYGRRTGRRWICSCRWRRRNSDEPGFVVPSSSCCTVYLLCLMLSIFSMPYFTVYEWCRYGRWGEKLLSSGKLKVRSNILLDVPPWYEIGLSAPVPTVSRAKAGVEMHMLSSY